MKSYCITEYGKPLELVEGDTPTPQGGEVLVEISGCGVCDVNSVRDCAPASDRRPSRAS